VAGAPGSPLFALVERLKRAGWSCDAGPPAAPLAGRVLGFAAVADFASRVRRCVAPGEQVWWLGSEQFLDDSGEGWDFLETQVALPSAAGDAAWSGQVRAFWSAHLPFALSVRGDYAYLAVDRDGRVWEGWAPELEAPTLVAESVDAFAARFAAELDAGTGSLHATWVADA
jgi:hypothetical protein